MSDEQAFAALSRRACPPVGEALFAVAASWRPVSWGEIDAKLDHLARPLFAAAPGGRERAGALAELLAGNFRPEGKAVEGLWLDEVLSLAARPPAAARGGGHRARPARRLADHGLLEPGRLVRRAGRRRRAVAGRPDRRGERRARAQDGAPPLRARGRVRRAHRPRRAVRRLERRGARPPAARPPRRVLAVAGCA